MEREYFDARFDGLEKIMAVQQQNMTNHITAVSGNVKRVEDSLNEHKESTEAHGLGEGRRWSDSLAKWGSVFLAAVAIILGIRKH